MDVKSVKLEPILFEGFEKYQKGNKENNPTQYINPKSHFRRHPSNGSSSALSTGRSGISGVDQDQFPVNNPTLCSPLYAHAAPLCRQFWKAGNYEHVPSSKSTLLNSSSYLHIHPKFLHSNATSHKWAFGAIAELVDNAVDEIQNGATLVIVDKTLNPRDGSPALLIQDNGGGMDPDAMLQCLSFGFSDKKSKSAIGKYGNGFKTSSMRLGADVVVFSRHLRKLTQSIGLLSYTFLTKTGQDRILVPMVSYELEKSNDTLNILNRLHEENFMSNLSMLLQWSPYSTEAELLEQFGDIGFHGTKVIIYNLWYIDDGNLELDFESDHEDIRIAGNASTLMRGRSRMATSICEQQLANRLRFSLRAYLSVLYLRVPLDFCILLRGQVVEYHCISSQLKFPEFIVYRPQSGGCTEGTVITTIGFLKDAPNVNIHGFCVYHKNRLILPFWHVLSSNNSKGRGVIGVLEANFIQPTHNKQDFEKTSVFQKLENRLKEMTKEYWDYHCGLIGYQQTKKPHPSITSQVSYDLGQICGTHQRVGLSERSSSVGFTSQPPVSRVTQPSMRSFSNYLAGFPKNPMPDFRTDTQIVAHLKRKEHDHPEPENRKRRAANNLEMLSVPSTGNQLRDQEAINLLQENKRLRVQCLECMMRKEELNLKVTLLKAELSDVQRDYARLLAESIGQENVKEEKKVV